MTKTEREKARRKKLQDQGLCICGELPEEGKKCCPKCLDRIRKRRQHYIDQGLCVRCCRKLLTEVTKHCQECLEAIKTTRRKERNQAIEMLGGKCVYCGGIFKLQIDHIIPLNRKKAGTACSDLVIKRILSGKLPITEVQLACKHCNRMKGNMSHDAFLNHVRTIHAYSCSLRL